MFQHDAIPSHPERPRRRTPGGGPEDPKPVGASSSVTWHIDDGTMSCGTMFEGFGGSILRGIDPNFDL